MHQRSFPFEVKREPDENGSFEGYASVFEVVDGGMDVVSRGAFAKSLGSRKVKMLWQHDMAQPIGVWDSIEEDDRGLFVKGRLLKDVQKGREAMALIREGAIDSMSIGYRTVEAVREGNGSVRRLTEIDLFEVSLVTVPMNESAMITSMKAADIATERDFEAFLRDAGYSRKEATAIALYGFKAVAGQRDAGLVDARDEGFDALLQQVRQLQEKFTNV